MKSNEYTLFQVYSRPDMTLEPQHANLEVRAPSAAILM